MRSRICVLGNASKWGWPEKNENEIKLFDLWFLHDQVIFWALKVLIKAFIMLRDHSFWPTPFANNALSSCKSPIDM